MFCLFKRNKKNTSDNLEYVSYEDSSSKDEVNNDYMEFIIPENKIPVKCPKCDTIYKRDEEASVSKTEATILKNRLVSRMKVKSTCPVCGTISVHYFQLNKITVTEITNVMTGERIKLEE